MIVGDNITIRTYNHSTAGCLPLWRLHLALLLAVSLVRITKEAERSKEVTERVILHLYGLNLRILYIFNMNNRRKCLLCSISQVNRLAGNHCFCRRCSVHLNESSCRKGKCTYAHCTQNILTKHSHTYLF